MPGALAGYWAWVVSSDHADLGPIMSSPRQFGKLESIGQWAMSVLFVVCGRELDNKTFDNQSTKYKYFYIKPRVQGQNRG